MNLELLVNGRAKLAALIGNPVGHTFSPYIHNTLSRETGSNLIYIPLQVYDKVKLENSLAALNDLGAVGVNITLPYKTDVIEYVAHIDETAKRIVSVNTIAFRSDGYYGFNTDISGFLKGYSRDIGDDLKNKRISVIGAGGAARSIAFAAALSGASIIYIVNRTLAHADKVVDDIKRQFNVNIFSRPLCSPDVQHILRECDVIVNTTTVGMYPLMGSSPLPPLSGLDKRQVVYDIIYRPFKSALLEQAEEKGCKTANGLSMLLYQAIGSFEIWTGAHIEELLTEQVRSALERLLTKGEEK